MLMHHYISLFEVAMNYGFFNRMIHVFLIIYFDASPTNLGNSLELVPKVSIVELLVF